MSDDLSSRQVESIKIVHEPQQCQVVGGQIQTPHLRISQEANEEKQKKPENPNQDSCCSILDQLETIQTDLWEAWNMGLESSNAEVSMV